MVKCFMMDTSSSSAYDHPMASIPTSALPHPGVFQLAVHQLEPAATRVAIHHFPWPMAGGCPMVGQGHGCIPKLQVPFPQRIFFMLGDTDDLQKGQLTATSNNPHGHGFRIKHPLPTIPPVLIRSPTFNLPAMFSPSHQPLAGG